MLTILVLEDNMIRMKNGNRKNIIILFCVLFFLILTAGIWAEDQCVKCHTSARSLIKAVRELEAERGELIVESLESVGEG